MHPSPLFLLWIFVFPLSSTSQKEPDRYKDCAPSLFTCGSFEYNVSYPFLVDGRRDICGLSMFKLTCKKDNPEIVICSETFLVRNISYNDRILSVVYKDLEEQQCPLLWLIPVVDSSLFWIPELSYNITFYYNCSSPTQDPGFYNVTCLEEYFSGRPSYYTLQPPPVAFTIDCKVSSWGLGTDLWQRLKTDGLGVLTQDFSRGIDVQWIAGDDWCGGCKISGGWCGYNWKDPLEQRCFCEDQLRDGNCSGTPIRGERLDPLIFDFDAPVGWCGDCVRSGGWCHNGTASLGEWYCLCEDQPHHGNCFGTPIKGQSKSTKKKFIIIAGIASGVGCILLLLSILFYPTISSCICGRRRTSPRNPHLFWKKRTSVAYKVEVFLDNYGSHAPLRYKYSDLKKITNSFRDKLGQGGYGSVFKGKLANGHLVAVKLLSESKGNGEEFINEVSSIGRTSHINIVTLLGFCSEGSKRALVYDFMPNGSLEKFIYSKTLQNAYPLGWEKLYQIAVGIAKGLEYLHNGCNTRILHFDIKPHNILLDPDFCPKISDFGLAKLCPANINTVSMLGARGTVGYIAPEVCCRNFGRVSHKSDVYSYGMMVLEMVGGRKNIDIHVENTSEIYFPQWVYKRLALNNDLDLQGIVSENEERMAKRMMIMSLWCVQSDPSDRPSMSRVVQMLEGIHEELKMPPNPFPASPRS